MDRWVGVAAEGHCVSHIQVRCSTIWLVDYHRYKILTKVYSDTGFLHGVSELQAEWFRVARLSLRESGCPRLHAGLHLSYIPGCLY